MSGRRTEKNTRTPSSRDVTLNKDFSKAAAVENALMSFDLAIESEYSADDGDYLESPKSSKRRSSKSLRSPKSKSNNSPRSSSRTESRNRSAEKSSRKLDDNVLKLSSHSATSTRSKGLKNSTGNLNCGSSHSRKIRRSRSTRHPESGKSRAPSRSQSTRARLLESSSHSRSSRAGLRRHKSTRDPVASAENMLQPASPQRRRRQYSRETSSTDGEGSLSPRKRAPSSPRKSSHRHLSLLESPTNRKDGPSQRSQRSTSRKGGFGESSPTDQKNGIDRSQGSSKGRQRKSSSRKTSKSSKPKSKKSTRSLNKLDSTRNDDKKIGTNDDLSSKASSNGEKSSVLQFDPTQADNVYRVKQVQKSEGFSHSQDGENLEVSIAELKDPLAGAQSFAMPEKTKKPMFDFLGANDDAINAFTNVGDGGDEHDEQLSLGFGDDESPANDFPVKEGPNHRNNLNMPSGGEEDNDSGVDYLKIQRQEQKPGGLPATMDQMSDHYDFVSYGSDYASETEGTHRQDIKEIQRQSFLDMPTIDSMPFGENSDDSGEVKDKRGGNKTPSRSRSTRRLRRTRSSATASSNSDGSRKRRHRRKKPTSHPTEPLGTNQSSGSRSPVKTRNKKGSGLKGQLTDPFPSNFPLSRPIGFEKGGFGESLSVMSLESSAYESSYHSAAEDSVMTSATSKSRGQRLKTLGSSIGRYFSKNRSGNTTDTDDEGRSVSSRSIFRRGKHHQLLADEPSSGESDDNDMF